MRHATGGQGPRPSPRRVAVAGWVHALSCRVLKKRAAPAAALLGPNLAYGLAIATGLWVGIRDEFEASARTVRVEQERRRCQASASSEHQHRVCGSCVSGAAVRSAGAPRVRCVHVSFSQIMWDVRQQNSGVCESQAVILGALSAS